MLIFTRDRERLLTHFLKDPDLFAYHIADLAEPFFSHCQWGVRHASYTKIDDVALLYTGGPTPTLLAFGIGTSYDELLDELAPLLPDRFYLHILAKHLPVMRRSFHLEMLGTHVKMKLVAPPKTMVDLPAGMAYTGLTPEDTEELVSFYGEAYPGNYFEPFMLATGWYRGLYLQEKLVAAGGVHAVSSEHTLAVLGNIAVSSYQRGHGVGKLLTAHLVKELCTEGYHLSLNVAQTNAAACTLYSHLGFESCWNYEEALCTRITL